MNITIGVLLQILRDIVPLLEREGLLDAEGNFHEPDAQHWTALAGDVETVLKAHGLTVPGKVDQALALLPLILGLLS